MSRLSSRHKNLIAMAGFATLAAAATYLFLVLPAKRQVEDEAKELDRRRQYLTKTGWPLDVPQLDEVKAQLGERLAGADSKGGIRAAARTVLARANTPLETRIRKHFATREDFLTAVGRLDYQDHLGRVTRNLAERGVLLHPEVLGLAEDNSSPYVYQLVLHVWALDLLVNHMLDAGLTIEGNPTATVDRNGRKQPAADIAALPMKAYLLRPTDTRPYLLEFPVRLTVSGPLTEVEAVIRSLTSEELFIPVKRVQIRAMVPRRADSGDGDGQAVRVPGVSCELECSAFYSLLKADDDTPFRPKPSDGPAAAPSGI